VFDVTSELVERTRHGGGPAFLLCNTYRYHGHHVGDVDRAYYRAKDEEELWQGERDPLALHGRWLDTSHGLRWGKATLEVSLAVLESASTRREVLLRHQIATAD